jgi:hypothetical protein
MSIETSKKSAFDNGLDTENYFKFVEVLKRIRVEQTTSRDDIALLKKVLDLETATESEALITQTMQALISRELDSKRKEFSEVINNVMDFALALGIEKEKIKRFWLNQVEHAFDHYPFGTKK